jgi:hypothetical protein
MCTSLHLCDATAPGADHDAHPVDVLGAKIQVGVSHSLTGHGQRKLSRASGAASHFAIHVTEWIKILDLTGDAYGETSSVKSSDRPSAGDARCQATPEGGYVIANGRDNAQTSNYDTSHNSSSLIGVCW